MKKIFGLAFIAMIGLSVPSFAQSTVDNAAHDVKKGTTKAAHGVKTGATKAWHGTEKGAKAVGNKTAEVTEKGVARVTDKKSDQWIGPSGQTIYIDDVGKYYWINGKGKKIYVSESALKAKTAH